MIVPWLATSITTRSSPSFMSSSEIGGGHASHDLAQDARMKPAFFVHSPAWAQSAQPGSSSTHSSAPLLTNGTTSRSTSVPHRGVDIAPVLFIFLASQSLKWLHNNNGAAQRP